MSLVELIAQADERALAASGLACLDRCAPLLGGDDEVLRPLWTSLADGAEGETWGECLERARAKLPSLFGEPGEEPGEEAGEEAGEDRALQLARTMLVTAPAVPAGTPVREWADACSVAALRIHRLLEVMIPAGDAGDAGDAGGADGADDIGSRREGRTEGMSPLVAAELRRQITVLELLAGTGSGGLRQVLAVSTEGRRVLRAVVSRRARGRS